MFVKDWMSTEPLALDVDDTVERAIHLFMERNPSLLPVVSEGKLVGIITPRDLRRSVLSEESWVDPQTISEQTSQLRVEAVMNRTPVAVPPDYTVEETSELLLERRIPGCPVLDSKGRLVGIITKRDLLRAFTLSSSIRNLGILFGFLVEDREDCIKALLSIFRKHDARLVAIMSSYANAPEGFRHVYIRVFHVDRRRMPELQRELRDTAKMLFMVDRKEGTRELFTS
ncbi:MAG: CBS and ACT domain-containing protein [Desulfomonilaceae bacterium]